MGNQPNQPSTWQHSSPAHLPWSPSVCQEVCCTLPISSLCCHSNTQLEIHDSSHGIRWQTCILPASLEDGNPTLDGQELAVPGRRLFLLQKIHFNFELCRDLQHSQPPSWTPHFTAQSQQPCAGAPSQLRWLLHWKGRHLAGLYSVWCRTSTASRPMQQKW